MPAKARDLQAAARRLGFAPARQRGSHQRWKHADGRSTTIPIHGDSDVKGGVYFDILKQLGITEAEFRRLK